MKKIKVMSVFGTRPEAIKMAPLVQTLAQRPEFESICCLTGQHREMLDQVLSVFGIVPEHDLAIMKPGQTLFDITSDVLLKIQAVLAEERPDVVLVHGDTTTSFAAALAAFYLQIPVGARRGRPAHAQPALPLAGGVQPPGGRRDLELVLRSNGDEPTESAR